MPCQECSERAKRDTQDGRATPLHVSTCGLEHEGSCTQATELLWHVCPLCYSQGFRTPPERVGELLLNLQVFKARINDEIGQEARIVIKKSVQRVDPEWLITLLRIMKMKKTLNRVIETHDGVTFLNL